MLKPTIFLDLDGMVVNLQQRLVDIYNYDAIARYGFYRKSGDPPFSDPLVTVIDCWTTKAHDGRTVAEYCNDYLDQDNVFASTSPMSGALDAIVELQTMGHVVVLSSPSRNPDSATAKIRWVAEHVPSIHRRDIILAKHKHLLRGDVFLEDRGNNIVMIRETNPKAFIGAIAYPYNKKAEPALNTRAEGMSDPEAAWKVLVADVQMFLVKGGS